MQKLLRKPSPALVVACLALAVALSGTGYAAIKLPKNSVGAVQLKKNAVVSSKVKNRSLKAVDFIKGQLPKGEKGDRGDTGPRGATGNTGPQGTPGLSDVEVVEVDSAINSSAWREVFVNCPAGKTAIGGGSSVIYTPEYVSVTDHPWNTSSWYVFGREIGSGTTYDWGLTGFAVCARVS